MKNLIILSIFLISACSKEKFIQGRKSLSEDFDSYQTLENISEVNEPVINFFQLSERYPDNRLSIDSTISLSPQNAIHCFAKATKDGDASKAGIANNKMSFVEGETVSIVANYFIANSESLDQLFIMDLEETILIGSGPGIRLRLVGEEGYLNVERKKMGEGTLAQSEDTKIVFPRNQWVNVRLEVNLSQKKKGWIKVYQDDVLIIQSDNERTLPIDRLTHNQGTKGVYNSIQFGITANTAERDLDLYLDDIEVKIID